MKKIFSFVLLLLISVVGFAQVKIHSHNDYEQKKPLFLVDEARADQIETDVFFCDLATEDSWQTQLAIGATIIGAGKVQ